MDESKCYFCEVVEGTKQARVVYETDAIIALIDPRQANPGHILVIPKDHAETLHETSPKALAEILPLIATIVNALGIENYNILQNNGQIAHQEVMHAHFHLIPKPDSSQGLDISWSPLHSIDQKSFADRIRSQI